MAPPKWIRVTGARVKTRNAVGGDVTHVDFLNKRCMVDFADGDPKELDASKLTLVGISTAVRWETIGPEDPDGDAKVQEKQSSGWWI